LPATPPLSGSKSAVAHRLCPCHRRDS
jgi:hypothetical protein